jgi:DNA sulfur modification protein DndB
MELSVAENIFPFMPVKQRHRQFLLTRLPAGLLTRISYAAVRGQQAEEGAVQRVLNTRRIASIKDFTLAGGDYPNSIVLNWVDQDHPVVRKDGVILVPDVPRAAQLIDGQHRVAGLQAAIQEDASIASFEIAVAIYEGLNTKECADIFLSINTEQKPAPRSLVFDLYGVADQQIVDPAAARARDIAYFLHESDGSPYRGLIKLPGAPRVKGGIALSTAVSAIKPLVESKGDLDQVDLTSLELQERLFLNFFSALRDKYGPEWDEKNNAFMYAAGFIGAVDFLKRKLIPYCNVRKSFTKETISKSIDLDKSNLVLQEEVKGVGGKDAPRVIFDRLVEVFEPESKQAAFIEI